MESFQASLSIRPSYGGGGRGKGEKLTSLPLSLPFFAFSPETPDTQATFKRKKIPLLSERQRRARLRFAKKSKSKLTAEDCKDFLFTDECPKYLFQYPNPENNIVWGSQECDVPPAYQAKQSAKVIVWGGMMDHGLTRLVHILPSGQTLTSEYSCQRDSRK